MDPLSLIATCITLIGAITKASSVVTIFVRDVRAARSDLDAVSREFLSLKTILELLSDDISDPTNESFPETLKKQIAGIVTNCSGVVAEIEQTLQKHESTRLSKAVQWATSGKGDIAKLRLSLEAHKSALEIALDMVTL
jgi:phage tail tape-measure protein